MCPIVRLVTGRFNFEITRQKSVALAGAFRGGLFGFYVR
jgi:hypothetical protein